MISGQRMTDFQQQVNHLYNLVKKLGERDSKATDNNTVAILDDLIMLEEKIDDLLNN